MHLRAPRKQYPTPVLLSFEVQGDLRHTPCPLRIHTPTLIPLTRHYIGVVADNPRNPPGTIEQRPILCASGGERDDVAAATLMPGIGIARTANRGLYTLWPPAPNATTDTTPVRHSGDNPRYYYQPGKRITCARTHKIMRTIVFAKNAPHLMYYPIGLAADKSLPADSQRRART